ncbi:MAG: class I SAM-dependent rRNA methyltransferase [Deltaproteobacteria bacterium]|nr:class I SAM-dependent rRNA methyltransferase [Deltaproteobacteria bacterium]
MVQIIVTKKCAERLRGTHPKGGSGHVWVFNNEIKAVNGNYSNGDIVSVTDGKTRFVGKGYINDNSKIIIRILSFKDEPIDKSFFRKRIENALKHRLSLGWQIDDSFRVVFSEGDLIPGLIVDKYGDILSLQILTFGMEKWKTDVVEILKDIFKPKTIVERSDVETRKKEGLSPRKGFLWGDENSKVVIALDGLKFEIDLLEGHKTGFYLDQQENRKIIEPYVKDKRVLDCFAYTGAFAMYAAKYGAKEVVALEDSGKIFEMLNRNIQLNGFENIIKQEKGDAFDWLREQYKKGERFDCVILDPPSFVKGKEAMAGAWRGYKDINILGLKLLNDNGYLITSSCSQNISPTAFLDILNDAARDAGCMLQLVENRSQAKDHPILLGMPETHYLKVVAARKVAK